jgi:hypothetical protein
MLHVTLREPGEYKLWLQFRGENALYVALSDNPGRGS